MRKMFSVLILILMSGWVLNTWAITPENAEVIYDTDGFVVQTSTVSNNDISPQADTPSPQADTVLIDAQDVKRGTLASCFDYYTFGSIGIDLTPDRNTYTSGEPVMLTGAIKNNNRYPVTGLDIKARIVKDIPNPDPMRATMMVLEEVEIASDISIDANGEYSISYTHILPLNAPSGNYQILLYAVEQDRFNLSGLSFTNDIVASRVSFAVTGTQPNYTYLDQTQILVGDQSHNVMAFMTQHQSDKSVPITIPLKNPTNTEKRIKVTYDVYAWDSALSENKIESKIEEVLIPAQSSQVLTYTIISPRAPVYYLRITAEPLGLTKDATVISEKTISNIRFVIQGLSQPRLNFIGVDTYPLTPSKEATLITCFHNTNDLADLHKTKIETIIYDTNRREIAKTIYEGKTIADITGLIQKFTPNDTLSEFTVESKMISETGEIIDTVVKKYTCKDINSSVCVETPKEQTLIPVLSRGGFLPLLGLAFLIVLVGLIVVLKRKK